MKGQFPNVVRVPHEVGSELRRRMEGAEKVEERGSERSRDGKEEGDEEKPEQKGRPKPPTPPSLTTEHKQEPPASPHPRR